MKNYLIKRTKRKNVLIKVNEDGSVVVFAPKRMAEKRIVEFVNSKMEWIEKNVTKMQKRECLHPKLRLCDGESVSILGETFAIFICEKVRTQFDGKKILLPTEGKEESFTKLLKDFAKKYICSRVNEIARLTNKTFGKIKISSAKTRWGSCSYKNDLSFTFRLMFANKSAIDYVIVHELCHTVHKNHSKEFWQEVKSLMPNFELAERYLKENVAIMNIV